MLQDFSRAFSYTLDFYSKRFAILILFSIPAALAFLITLFVPAPSYLALGGTYIRIGSLPELTNADVMLTIVAYAISVFIIADTIVNINLIIKSKRTLTQASSEIVRGMQEYATRIFLVLTIILLLTFTFQLVVYDLHSQPILFSIFSFVLSFLLFFVAPAIVIDDSDTPSAVYRSISLSLKKFHLVLLWIILGLVALSFAKVVGDVVFRSYSSLFVLLVNSLFILPFLIVLQTQMYMEKYPLAK